MRKQIDILCGGETAFERVVVDVADVLGITCGGRCGDIRTNTRNAAGMLIVVPSAEKDSSCVARTIDVAKKLGKPYHVLQPDSPGENVGWKCQMWLYGLPEQGIVGFRSMGGAARVDMGADVLRPMV